MARPDIPADGPEASLARIVRRLRLPYSRGFVARLVAAHPRAQTLLAVVEVAPSLGLKVTPAEVDAAALEEVETPFIVHFGGADGGGFGVVEEVGRDGVAVWDSAHGRRTIPRGDFFAHWTGIVTLIERVDGERAREPHHRRNRVSETVFGMSDAPGPARGPGATALRVALGALLVTLVGAAVIGAPEGDTAAAGAVALLSGAGLAITILTALATSAHSNPVSQRVCARGTLVDCHSVLSSRYSRIFGIPLSDIGIAFYGALLLLLATNAGAGSGRAVWAVATIAYATAVPLSLALIGVQVAMRRLCTLCLGVHAVNLSAAAIGWLALRPARWPAGRLAADGALVLLLVFVVLFFVVPYFRKSHGLEVVAGMHRRLSGSPFASLAGLLTEAPTELRGAEYAIRVGEGSAGHELVVFVHPSCNRCNPVLQEVTALAGSGLVEAYVGLVPKDPDDADRDACAAVLSVALALGPERVFEAYAAAKRSFASMIAGDAVQVLAGQLGVSEQQMRQASVDARRRVDRSEDLVDAHADGTPALFFDGRVYRGPLAHLASLLTENPALLDPTRAAEGTRRS
jgi:uncharacterized membrane protein